MKSPSLAFFMCLGLATLFASPALGDSNPIWELGCENRDIGFENNCPPENPTPPGSRKTCSACAGSIRNCRNLCGIGCDTYDEHYPPAGEHGGPYTCPRPVGEYGAIEDVIWLLLDEVNYGDTLR